MDDPPTDFAAERRWTSLHPETRELLLANVWCGHCRHEVRIQAYQVIPSPGGIILDGACAVCHRRVRRFVENS